MSHLDEPTNTLDKVQMTEGAKFKGRSTVYRLRSMLTITHWQSECHEVIHFQGGTLYYPNLQYSIYKATQIVSPSNSHTLTLILFSVISMLILTLELGREKPTCVKANASCSHCSITSILKTRLKVPSDWLKVQSLATKHYNGFMLQQ